MSEIVHQRNGGTNVAPGTQTAAPGTSSSQPRDQLGRELNDALGPERNRHARDRNAVVGVSSVTFAEMILDFLEEGVDPRSCGIRSRVLL